MKLRHYLLTLILTGWSCLQVQAANDRWLGDKYSMFIHYGLYSIPAGVFDGKPVTRGYSEQIYTFGIGFSDWYEAYTKQFMADQFDADAIVKLAIDGGMRSIVMTAKHHDGFCLFRTNTTSYNTYDATPAHRDLIKELADACHRYGMGFGVYFSLIDWHYPYAIPFSSHNADPITPEHHRYNMAQVTELMTHYGQVDEIWFDMGSLLPAQSRELYDLVHRLQPSCMVSGRLGNDYADFCVMGDNEYPDYTMEMPWQTATSFFDETWGYRSWQKRGEVSDKVREKMSSLIRVVADGGKYLLNIGPKGDGSVVPFEDKVIKRIGTLLQPIEQAIYDTHPNPYPHYVSTPPMTISSDRKTLYLFVPDTVRSVSLPYMAVSPDSIYALNESNMTRLTFKDHTLHMAIDHSSLPKDAPYGVIKMTFSAPLDISAATRPVAADTLTPLNAQLLNAQSSVDYYSSFRSIVGYKWSLQVPMSDHLELSYTDAEVGRRLVLKVGSTSADTITLTPTKSHSVSFDHKLIDWESTRTATERGLFGRSSDKYILPSRYNTDDWTVSSSNLPGTVDTLLRSRGGIYYRCEVNVHEDLDLPLDIAYRDGFLVYVDGQYFAGELLRVPSATDANRLMLRIPLKRGRHIITFKVYNRWWDTAFLHLSIPETYQVHTSSYAIPKGGKDLTLQKIMEIPYASPMSLYNIHIH